MPKEWLGRTWSYGGFTLRCCCRRRPQDAAPSPELTEVCLCGQLFGSDDIFCRMCGAKRPEAPPGIEIEAPMQYDDTEIEFEREDTTQTMGSSFSLEDDQEWVDDSASLCSRGSAQSSFSLEDDDNVPGRRRANLQAGGSTSSGGPGGGPGSTVLINLYDFGNVSGVLNRTVFSSMGMGVFHCAIEVYNLEWSFVYRKSSSRSGGTGVIQNKPQKLNNYNFNQSIMVGWTDWSEDEVKREIRRLSHQWRAKSYHVTRRNCITFVEEFVQRLGLGANFPGWVKKAADLSRSSPTLSAVVDSTWEMLAGVESTVVPRATEADQEMQPPLPDDNFASPCNKASDLGLHVADQEEELRL